MTNIRFKRDCIVEGIRRRAGEYVSCLDGTAKHCVDGGVASYAMSVSDAERRDAQPVSPNRMKFASLVKALDPHAEDFAEQVARLQDEYQKREGLVRELVHVYTINTGENLYLLLGPNDADVAAFDAAMRAAIERFVVDRF